MAAASSEKPLTRKHTEIWLVGQLSPCLNPSKLPTKNEVMALFFYYKETEKKTVRDACHETAKYVLEVWSKANIATRLKKHVVDKIEVPFYTENTLQIMIFVFQEDSALAHLVCNIEQTSQLHFF